VTASIAKGQPIREVSAMGYGRGTKTFVELFYGGALLLFLLSTVGGRWFVAVAVLIVVGCYGVGWYVGVLREKAAQRKPCEHGVRGAVRDPTRCPECHQQRERDAEAQRIRKAEAERAAEQVRREKYEAWREQVRLPEYLKTIDPQEFEQLVCRLFRQMGYAVEPTPYRGDNGSDGFLSKNGKRSVLQCKRVKGAVGEPVLRDLYGTMHATACQSAVVVTTGSVSKQARAWVSSKPIQIIELDELQRLLRTHFGEGRVVPADFTVSGWVEACPACGKQLRMVNGRRGRFVGCSGYPSCRYTKRSVGKR
jgi:ssDNA-binding Zn-finger/Zn-ribbon topoisomerase 1